jgi:hypothetical protein
LTKPHSGQWSATRSLLGVGGLGPGRAAGEDVGELLHVVTGDDVFPALVLLAQAVDQLRAQDVDLPVQDPALVGDVDLLLGELLDVLLQLRVGERAKVRKRVNGPSIPADRARSS